MPPPLSSNLFSDGGQFDQYVHRKRNGNSKIYNLKQSIAVSDITSFQLLESDDIFDGLGHSITLTNINTFSGLFATNMSSSGIKIKNLTVCMSFNNLQYDVCGFMMDNSNGFIIEDCKFIGNVITTESTYSASALCLTCNNFEIRNVSIEGMLSGGNSTGICAPGSITYGNAYIDNVRLNCSITFGACGFIGSDSISTVTSPIRVKISNCVINGVIDNSTGFIGANSIVVQNFNLKCKICNCHIKGQLINNSVGYIGHSSIIVSNPPSPVNILRIKFEYVSIDAFIDSSTGFVDHNSIYSSLGTIIFKMSNCNINADCQSSNCFISSHSFLGNIQSSIEDCNINGNITNCSGLVGSNSVQTLNVGDYIDFTINRCSFSEKAIITTSFVIFDFISIINNNLLSIINININHIKYGNAVNSVLLATQSISNNCSLNLHDVQCKSLKNSQFFDACFLTNLSNINQHINIHDINIDGEFSGSCIISHSISNSDGNLIDINISNITVHKSIENFSSAVYGNENILNNSGILILNISNVKLCGISNNSAAVIGHNFNASFSNTMYIKIKDIHVTGSIKDSSAIIGSGFLSNGTGMYGNVNIKNIYIYGEIETNSAGIIGDGSFQFQSLVPSSELFTNYISIKNCHISKSITGKSAGIIATGYSVESSQNVYLHIHKIYVNADISDLSSGIIGNNYQNNGYILINDCHVNGKITNSSAGIIGQAHSPSGRPIVIQNCITKGYVYNNSAGIAGQDSAFAISKCKSYCLIKKHRDSGSLVGHISSNINRCSCIKSKVRDKNKAFADSKPVFYVRDVHEKSK